MLRLFIMCALLVGCASSYNKVKLPDATDGAVVRCKNKVDCYERSTEACAGAYSIIESSEGHTNDFAFIEHGFGSYVIRCAPKESKSNE